MNGLAGTASDIGNSFVNSAYSTANMVNSAVMQVGNAALAELGMVGSAQQAVPGAVGIADPAMLMALPSGGVVSEEIAAFEEAGTMANSTALSTYRVTQAGESFIRYESGDPAFSRATAEGGLIPSTFAAPSSEGLLPQSSLNAQYNLWSPEIPIVNAFQITPPAGTPIIGSRPVMGGLGSEVISQWAFGLGALVRLVLFHYTNQNTYAKT